MSTTEAFRLHEFLDDDDDRRAEWEQYVSETEKSLCRLYHTEPSTQMVRSAIVVGLRMSEDFRRFVVDRGGIEETRTEEAYLLVLEAGAGTIIHQCTENRAEGGADVVVSG